MSEPQKTPLGVPDVALWSETEKLWVLGHKDEKSQWVGSVLGFRQDGSLATLSFALNGLGQGPSFRFHENGELSQLAKMVDGRLAGEHRYYRSTEPTTETFFEGAPDQVKGVVYNHDSQAIVAFIDWSDTEIPVEEGLDQAVSKNEAVSSVQENRPPAGVPNSAYFRSDYQMWVIGLQMPNNQFHGPYVYYTAQGSINCICSFVGTVTEGVMMKFHPDGSLSESVIYKAGALVGDHIYHRNKSNPSAPFPPGAPEEVKTLVVNYDQGFPNFKKLIDWNGNELDATTLKPIAS